MDKVIKYPIYPRIVIDASIIKENIANHYELRNSIRITSYIRKQHKNGLWYLGLITRSWTHSNNNDKRSLDIDVINSLKQFYTEVYRYIILGIVDTKITMLDGKTHLWELDDNQDDEDERLKFK